MEFRLSQHYFRFYGIFAVVYSKARFCDYSYAGFYPIYYFFVAQYGLLIILEWVVRWKQEKKRNSMSFPLKPELTKNWICFVLCPFIFFRVSTSFYDNNMKRDKIDREKQPRSIYVFHSWQDRSAMHVTSEFETNGMFVS